MQWKQERKMNSVTATTGVEGEGCFSAYYNNHLYNQIENYILLLES